MVNTKLSALGSLASISTDDILYVVDDPSGTPTSKKIAWSAILGTANTFTANQIFDAKFITVSTSTTLTIASGAVTCVKITHRIDTEASAATDDLDTIAGHSNEELLFFRAADSSRDVTFKHNIGLSLERMYLGADFTFTTNVDTICLMYLGLGTGVWGKISSSDNL